MVRRPKADWVLGVWGWGFGVFEILGFLGFQIIMTHVICFKLKFMNLKYLKHER
jgi:hypothetical protein